MLQGAALDAIAKLSLPLKAFDIDTIAMYHSISLRFNSTTNFSFQTFRKGLKILRISMKANVINLPHQQTLQSCYQFVRISLQKMADSLAPLSNNPALDCKTRQGSPLAVPCACWLLSNLETHHSKCRDTEIHQE